MQRDEVSGNPEAAQDSGEVEFDEVAFAASLQAPPPNAESEEEPKEEAEAEVEETEAEETEEVEPTEESEAEEDKTEEEAEPEEESEDEEDVLSQIDFDQLTDDQKQAIAEAVGSGAGKEIGKLRAKVREAEERNQSLQKQLEEGLAKAIPRNTPFGDIKDLDKLSEKESELRNNYQYAKKLVDKGEDEYEINGEYVKRDQLIQWRDYYESQLEGIPQRKEAIKELEKIKGLADKELESAKTEVDFLNDESSDAYKEWKSYVDDPEFALIASAFPKMGAKLARMAAHSIAFTKGKVPTKAKVGKLPLKKPKAIAGTGGGAQSGRPDNSKDKKMSQLRSKVQSGEASAEELISAMFT